MFTAAPFMAKKPTHPGYCTYTPTKIDDEVMSLVIAAAALSGRKTIQEFLSDAANEVASRSLGRPPIKRRPAPPKPHGKGRPKKQG